MRITLDWDTAQDAADNLEDAKADLGMKAWELFRSANGSDEWPPDGAHFIGYGLGGVMAAQFALREKFGDDDRRLALDKWRWENGSPHISILFDRKRIRRSETPRNDSEDGPTWDSGRPSEKIGGTAFYPSDEKIKDDGSINYAAVVRALAKDEYFGSYAALGRDLKRYGHTDAKEPRKTVQQYASGRRSVSSRSVQKALLARARTRDVGHYVDGKSMDDARPGDEFAEGRTRRRSLIEYVDIVWDQSGDRHSDRGGDDYFRELNIQTSSVNPNNTNKQINAGHDKVVDHAMETLNPEHPKTGQKLDHTRATADQVTHEAAKQASRSSDAKMWEDRPLDADETEKYLGNLPTTEDNQDSATKHPVFEVILFDSGHGGSVEGTSALWHVIGIDNGDGLHNATIIKDTRGWW